jgi:hypothetical protein
MLSTMEATVKETAYIPELIPLKALAMFGRTPEIQAAARQALEEARRAAHAAKSGEGGLT